MTAPASPDRRSHDRPGVLPTLDIADLTIEFSRRRVWTPVVRGVSLRVMPGEIVGIIGESGSGKTLSSLAALRLLPRQARIAGGRIRLKDIDILAQTETGMRKLRERRQPRGQIVNRFIAADRFRQPFAAIRLSQEMPSWRALSTTSLRSAAMVWRTACCAGHKSKGSQRCCVAS